MPSEGSYPIPQPLPVICWTCQLDGLFKRFQIMSQSKSFLKLAATMLGSLALLLSAQLYASGQTTATNKADQSVATTKAVDSTKASTANKAVLFVAVVCPL